MAERVYNFAAGPSTMPESALKTAAAEMLDYKGSGMSVMEISHRSPLFQEIFDSAQEKLRALLRVPESHEILFLQGGATTQFAAIPMNLLEGGAADYAVTGNFSGKAAEEAAKYGTVRIAADTSATGHDRIPTQAELKLSPDAKYFYYCANNTIFGTEWQLVPQTAAPLVCDMSSDILSREIEVADYGLIYAGAQKNMGIAGLTVVIIRKDLIRSDVDPIVPSMMRYDLMAKNDSMYNTPPCWAIYMAGLCFHWVEDQGGIAALEAKNKEKSDLLYNYLDQSRLFHPVADKKDRSLMNVTFTLPTDEQTKAFLALCEERGMINIKGHRSVGGCRASIYNAMPIEGVQLLVQTMKEFEEKNMA